MISKRELLGQIAVLESHVSQLETLFEQLAKDIFRIDAKAVEDYEYDRNFAMRFYLDERFRKRTLAYSTPDWYKRMQQDQEAAKKCADCRAGIVAKVKEELAKDARTRSRAT